MNHFINYKILNNQTQTTFVLRIQSETSLKEQNWLHSICFINERTPIYRDIRTYTITIPLCTDGRMFT